MAAPLTKEDFLELVRRSEQVEPARFDAFVTGRTGLPTAPTQLAALMVREGLLTKFQAEQLLQGKWRGFSMGGYRILERLGSGGTGTVYLAEHQVMRRRVALKVLPTAKAEEKAVVERFRREAQAIAALNHPNIVRAYDFRQEGGLNFLVMEYVEGVSLQELLGRQGALDVGQAADYARQAALGLQHAHEAGLVHRDVKPANLLVDRSGTVKVLDLGLARYAPEGQESLTKQFDENMVVGTADYLSPEQAMSLHAVDIRADVYSLGATLYALLAGRPPFHEGTITQKLLWHHMREPASVRAVRPEVPEGLARIVARMMAKSPQERFPDPAAVALALLPFAHGPFPPADSSGLMASATNGSAVIAPRLSQPLAGVKAPAEAESRLEPAPSVAAPVPTGPRRLVRSGSMVWVAIFGSVAAALVLVATCGVGFLVWRAAQSARAVVQEPAPSGPGNDMAPPLVLPPPFALPDREGTLLVLLGHEGPIQAVAVSPDRRYVLSGSDDKTVRMWDLKDGSRQATITGHQGSVTAVGFTRDKSRALSASTDGTIRLWELPAGREVNRLTGHDGAVWSAVLSPDDKQVLSGGADKKVRLWDLSARRVVREFVGPKDVVQSVALAQVPRRQVLAGGLDRTLRLWNRDNGKPVRQFPIKDGAGITAVAFRPSGPLALTASQDGNARLWDLDRGKVVHVFKGHKGPVWCLAVSPDGKRGLTGGEDGTIRLWDIDKRRQLKVVGAHPRDVTAVAFVGERHCVSGSKDRTVRVWGLGR